MSDFASNLDLAAEKLRLAQSTDSGPKAVLVRLPWLMCAAAGGTTDQVDAPARAWVEMYDSMRLMDDVQDGDSVDAARDLALATGLYLRASLSLAQQQPVLVEDLYRRLLLVAEGQYQDVTHQQFDLAGAIEIAERKSGAFFAAGARIGALAAQAPQTLVEAATGFGGAVGTLIQLLDDLEWLEGARNGQTSRERASNIAIAYGRTRLDTVDRAELERGLGQMAGDREAAQRVAAQLIRAGARVDLGERAIRCGKHALTHLQPFGLGSHERQLLQQFVLDLLSIFRPAPPPPGSENDRPRR